MKGDRKKERMKGERKKEERNREKNGENERQRKKEWGEREGERGFPRLLLKSPMIDGVMFEKWNLNFRSKILP